MEQKLDFQTMENIEGGQKASCAKSVATLVFGAGALVGLSASMGVGLFVFTAAGGWYGLIEGAQGVAAHC